jgi:hypothetical protein
MSPASRKDFTYHSAYPLAGMHIPMPNDGRISPFPVIAPQMNASNVSVLDACTGNKDLGVFLGRGLQIREELSVLVKTVIRIEVGLAG